MKRQIIGNARVHGESGLHQITVNQDGIIEKIEPGEIRVREQDRVIGLTDVAGDYISLGGIDLQINGGLGLAFPDLQMSDLPKLKEICTYLWQQGVDGFLPTIVTTSLENIRRSLSVIRAFINQQSNTKATAQVLGVHLEGPFLQPAKKGAHPEEYLLPLTLERVKEVVGNDADIITKITLAPELDPTGETIKYLRQQGILISLGHSTATEDEAKRAFELGASTITHSFNAMPSLHHREPGLLGAAITNPDVSCGLIADGKHVSPTAIAILLRATQPEQVFLVSDALAPIGLPDGVYPWDSREITVKDGTARLANGTLSGTTLPLMVGVQNLVKWELCPWEDAIALATINPRRAIPLPTHMVGQKANLLRWHYQFETKQLTFQRLVLN